jgi:hypothetical protein
VVAGQAERAGHARAVVIRRLHREPGHEPQASSSILRLMPGDLLMLVCIASVLVRPSRRHGRPRGRLCPSRPPRSSFLVGHRRDASRTRGHILHAVASCKTCR